MDTKTSDVIFRVAAEIEAVLNEHPFAMPNQFVPKRIRFLAASLSGCDRYAAEKAYKIAQLADIFYSVRKHEKYRGGADALWAEMTFCLLNVIRSQANLRVSHGD